MELIIVVLTLALFFKFNQSIKYKVKNKDLEKEISECKFLVEQKEEFIEKNNSEITNLKENLKNCIQNNKNLEDRLLKMLKAIDIYEKDIKTKDKTLDIQFKTLEKCKDYKEIKVLNSAYERDNKAKERVIENYKKSELEHNKILIEYEKLKTIVDKIDNVELKIETIKNQGILIYNKLKNQVEEEKEKHEKLKIITINMINKTTRVKEELMQYEKQVDQKEYDIYQPIYIYHESETYKNKIELCLTKQKTLIEFDKAIINKSLKYNNENDYNFSRKTSAISKNMINLLNKESENITNKMTIRNGNNLLTKFEKAFNTINKINNINQYHKYEISEDFFNIKKEELLLKLDYEIAKNKAKEQQESIKIQMREEQREEKRIMKEIEKAKINAEIAEKEEKQYALELENIKEELRKNIEEQHKYEMLENQNKFTEENLKMEALNKEKEQNMNAIILKLEMDLKTAQEIKERNKSMAQQTRSGYVYVISNIGSFGEGVVKIGMTRRLEPLDRVKELGDASVPFTFDVHAMIYSTDAPALENELHKKFADYRINLVNLRKEFFRINLESIEEYLLEKKIDIKDINMIPTANEYFESISIREKAEKLGLPISSIINDNQIDFFDETEDLEGLEDAA